MKSISHDCKEVQLSPQQHICAVEVTEPRFCNKFPSCGNLLKHKAKDDKKNQYFDLGIEPKSSKPMGITYLCCVCDKEFEIASELAKHMAGH